MKKFLLFGKEIKKENKEVEQNNEMIEPLNKKLEKTKENIFKRITKSIFGKSKIDSEIIDSIEEALLLSDVGVETTVKILKNLEKKVQSGKYSDVNSINQALKEVISELLQENDLGIKTSFEEPLPYKPYVILVVGVNGTGKTTTVGKLAYHFRKAGKEVFLGAADTFRAAAIDQLTIWAERTDSHIVKQQMGSDPAAVAYDTLNSAIAKNADVVIIDTAGRLHNKINLMNELSKIKNVLGKLLPEAPHEVLLVLDASTGQNAFEQAKQFTSATKVNSIAITKLDGTAKGGVVIGISDQFKIPIKYIGVGEKPEDLRIFDKELFINALFD